MIGLLLRPHELSRLLLWELLFTQRRADTQHSSRQGCPDQVLGADGESVLGGERTLRNGASGQAPHLDAMRDVVNNEYSSTVFVARQGHVEPEHLHLPPRLRSSLLPVDGFAGRTLQTPILEKRVRQNEPSPSPQNSHVQMAGGRSQQGGLRPHQPLKELKPQWCSVEGRTVYKVLIS